MTVGPGAGPDYWPEPDDGKIPLDGSYCINCFDPTCPCRTIGSLRGQRKWHKWMRVPYSRAVITSFGLWDHYVVLPHQGWWRRLWNRIWRL